MKLSLYTYLFSRGKDFYLYNSESGLLATIPQALFETLYNGDFETIEENNLDMLKEKKILVENDHLYDYYNTSRLKFFSSIGNNNALNLIIAPTTACNFACPYS